MIVILDSKLEKEVIARQSYMYEVFHTYMIVNKKNNYIEINSFPKHILDYTFIIGHDSFAREYLKNNVVTTENFILISCGAKDIIKENYKNIKCKNVFVAKSQKYKLELFQGEEFGFNFEISDSELDLYNNRNKEQKIEISFDKIGGNDGENN